MEYRRGSTTIRVIQETLHKAPVQALVSPSTMTLTVAGDVDGALHRAAGAELLGHAQAIRKAHGNCPPGNAVITLAGNKLAADYVIHAVGPMWAGGQANEEDTLYTTYWNALWLAHQNEVESVALPSISTGAYRFPLDKAAMVSTQAVIKFIDEHPERFTSIWHVVRTETEAKAYGAGYTIALQQPPSTPKPEPKETI